MITINREAGSGGRTIGRKLAERLGINYYDKALIEGLVKRFDLSVSQIEAIKGRRHHWWTDYSNLIYPEGSVDFKDNYYTQTVTSREIFEVEKKIIEEIAGEESCVIAGRSAFFILKDHPGRVSIFIRASRQHRLERVMREQELSEEEASELIDKLDKRRENFTKEYSKTSRYDARNYDLVLNVDNLSEDEAVDIIVGYLERHG